MTEELELDLIEDFLDEKTRSLLLNLRGILTTESFYLIFCLDWTDDLFEALEELVNLSEHERIMLRREIRSDTEGLARAKQLADSILGFHAADGAVAA